MKLNHMIYQVRNNAKLTQAELAELLDVSPQAVQKWESGTSTPTLEKLIQIAKHFGISLDGMLLDRDPRVLENLLFNKKLTPNYAKLDDYESYPHDLMIEYNQSIEEGLDIEEYHDVFDAVGKLTQPEYKERFADILFDVILNAKTRSDYSYQEPSDITQIRALTKSYDFTFKQPDEKTLKEKIHGAWLGRICGCLLGKPVEGKRTDTLHPFLKATDNFPMHRYILSTDTYKERYAYFYADQIDGMPADDDTNYTVLAQEIIKKYGRNFTSYDVSRAWLDYQPKSAYCTAERVAYCNFVKGYEPPVSAMYKNKFREWIGAQIRGDYFGYINPGNPKLAADMAFRDASISHVKNGIYGEMFIAAMIACAAVTDNIIDIIRGGLAEIPATSRLYESIEKIVTGYEKGVAQKQCFANIHATYDEHKRHHWCHTISNAMIVVAALLYGNGNFGKSICMAVETGFDTDCNGATVGSILGMRNGVYGIGEEWTQPLHDKLYTTIFGVGVVSVKERAELTMTHIEK